MRRFRAAHWCCGKTVAISGEWARLMERWIVISNCQTLGLTNCLSLLNPDVAVEPCDIWQFRNEIDRWRNEIGNFHRIFLNDEILSLGLIDFSVLTNVLRVPAVEFCGYHPDLCYAYSEGTGLETPLGAYNSMIAHAAFRKGLSESDTRSLYNARIFEAGGYFELWNEEKRNLISYFSQYGYDLSESFRNWTMRDSFMHSMNHPRIDCLHDIAAMASIKIGRRIVPNTLRPHDNLCHGAIFPIYDEIAEALGIEGSYLFKVPSQYKTVTLEQFIAGSFAAYRQHDPAGMHVSEIFQRRYSAICDAI
jgi:hypothetical protein